MEYVYLLVGLAMLVAGGIWLVDGAATVATIIKVPKIVIGLSIVAIGTSIPEAAVTITAAIERNNEIAIGTIIGTNIFNILFIIGVCAFMKNMPTHEDILKRDFPWQMSTIMVFLIMLSNHNLVRVEGIIMILFFLVYAYMMAKDMSEVREKHSYKPTFKSGAFLIIGLAFVVVGGRFVVDSGSVIAKELGMTQGLMALTVLAIGTSLPELMTSFIAAKKGEYDIAVGNVLGSNIFNILVVLGAASIINPIQCTMYAIADVGIMLIATGIMCFFAWNHKATNRADGIIAVLLYILFVIYVSLR